VLLRVTDLTKHFQPRGAFGGGGSLIRAVEGVTFTLEYGKTLGLVGESGSGKSTTGRMIMRLIEPTAGNIQVGDVDITSMSRRQMRQVRRQMNIVFQDPFASLDPRMKVGKIVAEPLLYNTSLGAKERTKRVAMTLEQVGLDAEHAERHPHEFSGGQRQRIGIARAIILEPSLLILDEPVSALDVSIQAQVINLLQDLQAKRGMAYLLIAHDLSVVRQICDSVAVMYLGRIVEYGPRDEIFQNPTHPYTQALLSAVPISNPALRDQKERIVLVGDMPSPSNVPTGCSFRTRCFKAEELCTHQEPNLEAHFEDSQLTACHFAARTEPSKPRTPNKKRRK
jgi:peptide/nickel transport system ATP-binding protein/oligopeptide transport system ATP-binding protein